MNFQLQIKASMNSCQNYYRKLKANPVLSQRIFEADFLATLSGGNAGDPDLSS
jgi:hypothetical protein